MRQAVRGLIWYLTTTQPLRGPILEVGSRAAPGQTDFADLRPFFRGEKYTGCDTERGPGVDVVVSEYNLTFEDQAFNLVLCMDTLEHTRHPIHMMEEIERVLAPEGTVIVSTHMDAPVHYQFDFWRFTAQCMMEILLGQFAQKQVYYQGPKLCPTNIVGIGVKASDWPFDIDLTYLNQMLPFDGMPYPYERW